MAAACDPQTLLDAVACIECGIAPGLLPYLQISLLCKILNVSTSMACDPQTLLNDASCLECGLAPGIVPYVTVSLLCQILAAGGGGGGAGLKFTTGTGSPEGVVIGSPGDTYWDTATGFKFTKVTGAATTTGWLVH